jgi:hypothetical protein
MPAPAIGEPILAGLIVALINKYVVNNPNLFNYCSNAVPVSRDVEECSSSSSTSAYADAEIHPHVHMM